MPAGRREYDTGTEFIDPVSGQGYRLTAPLVFAQPITARHFEAINGAPESVPGQSLPRWLCEQLGLVA